MAILAGTRIHRTTTTTNATPANVDLIDLASPGFCEGLDGKDIFVDALFLATSTSGGGVVTIASAKMTGLFKRAGGTLTLIEVSTVTYLGTASLAIPTGSSQTLNASGTKIRAAVTGIAATTIDWTFHVRLHTN